jgi:hypothetical protein
MRRRASSVFAILLGATLATSSFRVETIDTAIRLEVARSLARSGSASIRPMEMRTPFGPVGSFEGEGGRSWSVYGLGQSILFLPAVWVGGARDAQLATLVNPLVTAATGAILVLLGAALGFSRTAATRLGLAWGLCTLAWPQAKLTFEAPIEAACLAGAMFFLVKPGRSAAAAAGCLVGFAILTRPSAAVMVPGLAILLGRGGDLRGRAAAAAAAAVPWIVLALVYNEVRWGSPLATGYARTGFRYFATPAESLEGLVGLLVSPGRGFFWYSPILLLAPWGFRALAARDRAVAASVAVLAASYVGFLSSTTIWAGDWTWGPRHLLPIGPPVALAMLPLLEPGKLRRLVAAPLVAVSVAVQLVGATSSYDGYFLWHNAELRRVGRPERAGRYHFGLTSAQIGVQTRQAVFLWSRAPERVGAFRSGDRSPYDPILDGPSPWTVRVPDVWWIYFPLLGVGRAATGGLALACALLVGGGSVALRRTGWRDGTG